MDVEVTDAAVLGLPHHMRGVGAPEGEMLLG